MYYKISKSANLAGDVKIPGSKSGTARGLVIGTLAEGVSRIINPMPGIDSYSIVDCCRALGAKINTDDENEWIIEGAGYKNIKVPGCVLARATTCSPPWLPRCTARQWSPATTRFATGPSPPCSVPYAR